MKRRMMLGGKKLPLLIKLSGNPGSDLSYTFERGYKYVDLLIIGGGGAGGYNAGGGGASGTIVYVHNLVIAMLSSKSMSYNLAKTSTGLGNSTNILLDGIQILVPGGYQGGRDGGAGGNGNPLNGVNISDLIALFSKYVINPSSDIAIANNGGGGGGLWNNDALVGYAGGSGASLSSWGQGGSGSTGGGGVLNGNGYGSNRGGNGHGLSNGGIGYGRSSILIPLNIFDGGGYSGRGSNSYPYPGGGSGSGGGAAGYDIGGDAATGGTGTGKQGGYGGGGGGGNSGASGGAGGSGIICLYYHN